MIFFEKLAGFHNILIANSFIQWVKKMFNGILLDVRGMEMS